MKSNKTPLGNSLVVASLVSLLGFAPYVLAETQAQDHKAHHPEQAQAGGEAKSPSGMMPMQGHMQKMHRTMDKIQAAEDPKERQKLLDDHMAQMHDMMNMMHGMQQGQTNAAMGGGMMGMMGPDMMRMMHGQQGGMMGNAPAGGPPCARMGSQGMSGGMMGGRGMHGGMMGSQGMHGGMMGSQGMSGRMMGKGMMGGGMTSHMQNRMDMMQQRMDMMQQMMAQMLQHQKESKQAQEPAKK
jgi:hypothetical protein